MRDHLARNEPTRYFFFTSQTKLPSKVDRTADETLPTLGRQAIGSTRRSLPGPLNGRSRSVLPCTVEGILNELNRECEKLVPTAAYFLEAAREA